MVAVVAAMAGVAAGAHDIERRSGTAVQRYLAAKERQQASQRGTEVDVEITARVAKLGRGGVLKAVRRSAGDGAVTYESVSYAGDGGVKREVIARYLAAEHRGDTAATAITPANYEFRWKETVETGRGRAEVFRLKPRKKRAGLFKGELWTDAETGMPLKETGELVRPPSLLLKRVRFLREYELSDGVARVRRIECTVETRLAGRTELTVTYGW
jgi:hypothetical protein